MGKARVKAAEDRLSAAQKAAIERIKILMGDIAFATLPSFLYTQKEILRKMEKDLSNLDNEYIKKHNVPVNMVKGLAREIYEDLMKKGDYDRAITVADHYKL